MALYFAEFVFRLLKAKKFYPTPSLKFNEKKYAKQETKIQFLCNAFRNETVE